MQYDFTTLLRRENEGSYKWDGMKRLKPDVSPDAVPFTTADMEFVTAPEIKTAIQEYVEHHILGYTGPTEAYLNSVCGWMRRIHGFEITPEEIVLYPGVVPALFHLVRALTNEGEGVIVMPPVYPPFFKAAGAYGRKVVLCPLKNHEESYTIDFDQLEQLCRKKNNTLLLLCSPHNPVGRVWSREELLRLVQLCAQNGVTVVSDEIHGDLILPGVTFTSMGALPEYAERTVLCTSQSKTFNLASMQTSNIIVKNGEMREKLLQVKEEAKIESMNVLGFVAGAAAYDLGEEWRRQMLDAVQENYNYFRDFLQESLPRLRLAPLEGTYLAWMDCRSLLQGKKEQELDRFLQEHELFFQGGLMFGAPEGYQRINLAAPKWVIEAMCRKLEAACRELESR